MSLCNSQAGALDEVRRELQLSNDDLNNITSLMMSAMERSLSSSESESSLEMLFSHVSSLHNKTREGTYLAIDLGGTNFRVLLIKIQEEGSSNLPAKFKVIAEVYSLPDEVLVSAEIFFDHIAKCLALFCQLNGVSGTQLPVGFTFSFPLRQECLNHAVLINWSKGFNVNGVIGKDVAQLLTEAIRKRGDINCEVVAVVNDTVGTLISCAQHEPSCKIGLIVGNGCNACYMEKVANVEKKLDSDYEGEQMCINMEWGTFGDNGDLNAFRNEYDRLVDSMSTNPNTHIYEKMICGKYLGELVRLVLVRLTENGVLFGGVGSEMLFTKGSFKSSFVLEIESISANRNFNPNFMIRNILLSLNISAGDNDCETVRQVCNMISIRAAHLCAAGVAAVALKIKANHSEEETMKISVAVDGTVYRKNLLFRDSLKHKVDELCQESGVALNFVSSYEGSGKGAALVAASAQQGKARLVSVPNSSQHGIFLSQTCS